MNQTRKDLRLRNRTTPDISALVYGKIPPQAAELEEAVLGAMILETDKQEDVFGIIPAAECFYVDAHQKIYAAMLEMKDQGMMIDLLTLTEQLRKREELEIVGGAHMVTKLASAVVSSAHAETHAYIVMEKFLSRELIRMGGDAITSGYDDTEDVFESIEAAEQRLDDLKNRAIIQPYKHVSRGVRVLQQTIYEQRDQKLEITGVTSGYRSLDGKIGGWEKGNVYVVAARPGVGKTGFALNLALNCVADRKYGGPVGIFNLEMSEEEINKRFVACLSGVPLDLINTPMRMTQNDQQQLDRSFSRLSTMPIFIDDTAGLTITQLSAKAAKMVRKDKVKLIIIDYLQLMESDRYANSREQEVSKISRDIKKLSKRLSVPIIALSQLSRQSEINNKEPGLADLRESGAIEQDASMVMFLWRPDKEMVKKKSEYAGKIAGLIRKNRHGVNNEDVLFTVNESIQKWEDSEAGYTVTNFSQVAPTAQDTPSLSTAPEQNDDLPF